MCRRRREPILSFVDWLEAVRYRWKLVAAVTAALLAVGALYIIFSPRVYQASSRLLVDVNAPSPVDKEDRNTGDVTRVLTTQADIVRTPAVAAVAAQLSGLTSQPAYINAWQKSTGGSIPLPNFVGAQLLKTLTVQPKRDTNVLLISADSSNPKVAAAVANSFAQAAVNAQYRLRTEPAKAYAAWLETRLLSARGEVRSAQDKLSNFVRATGITNDGDLSSEGSQMAEVETQLAAAQAKAAAAQQDSFAGTQGVADAERSDTVQRLRQQVAESRGKVAELEAVFGSQYPEVTRNRAQLQTLQSQLNSELSQARSAFTASRSADAAAERAAARASEARLRAVASQQRSKMMGMGTNLAQYSTLKNEFDAAKKSFNDINDRLVKMRLQGAVPETEVKIVDVATPPLLPSSPKTGLVLGICALLGLMLGAIAAIIQEALDPRVRGRRALERQLGVRVIGHVASPALMSPRLLLAGPRA
jgi:uncharacterized protein involved in exopolysaccharide biosynthesis